MSFSLNNILKPTIREKNLVCHELIGHGGYGEVYRATWKSKQGEVQAAAKKIPVTRSQGVSEELANEIKFLQTLNHPSIIKF